MELVVGYKGQSNLDTGYFFCPYIPGMPIVDVPRRPDPTEFQKKLLKSVQNQPMLRRISWNCLAG